ncbi:MAG: DUF4435 domain-containing protein [Acidovorax sp.]|nr:MAG: DUF4435 domain-containing protein [Acidovorax sp.]
MSYADYLRKQRNIFSAVWLQFSHAYKDSRREIFLFFEGQDDLTFFMPEIRRRANQSSVAISPFVCQGKRSVLRLIPVVRRRLDNNWRALFFVDKDVDNIVNQSRTTPDPYLYETDLYSIENYLVSSDTFSWFWTDILRLNPRDPRLAFFEKLYELLYEKTMQALTALMAWSIFHRKKGRRPNLNNLNMSKIFKLDSSGRLHRQGKVLSLLDQYCGVITPPSSWRGIRASARKLKTYRRKEYIRGKFEIWFFVHFIKLVIEILQSMGAPKTFPSLPSLQLALTEDNAIAVLAGRMPLPPSASHFLDSTWPP